MVFGVGHHRRSRARARARTVPPAPSGHEDAYPSVVQSLLQAIAPRDRALLYLLDVEGWTMADAADAVGIPVGRAKTRASRARRAARAALTPEEDVDG
jgi:RNA polymerase sigma-70 factor (ECF subfamily)